ncbi:1-deoxy-D-xylulose-5-phosphate reductoisomerase [Brevundimonas sp.]|uniref:1-deoxy-D-xylulose-5-phosphate reductoisomerase n=1 Tax=Brevundimonas sp. TaxID=1871086 RepID=UPI0025DA7AFB|nr:1-deoxy-D-xylulose-5-phosphate reductoisomerase [Brevundimonas sp.]
MSGRRRVTVLGSTGSVGTSTLDLMAQAGGRDVFEIEALTAGANVRLLAEQALEWRPRLAVIGRDDLKAELERALEGSGVRTASGEAAVEAAASGGADWIMAAIVGAAGLRPAWAAARSGATLALANKESLVCCGPALIEAARAAGGQVIPVDSEHSAIFQVLEPHNIDRVARLVLTASGGPFRTMSLAEMKAVTPEQAVAHPNWSMGAKISVDSATMANKGLEMIEAAYLFGVDAARIDVLVHPQSIIHSLVEYVDGSTLAQLGPPDMRTPIACALAWPERIAWPAPRLDLAALGSLTFEAPDDVRFPMLRLARQALSAGGAAPAVFNAANEAAVQAFLDRRIGFLDIAATVAETLEESEGGSFGGTEADPLGKALQADRSARRLAMEAVGRRALAA